MEAKQQAFLDQISQIAANGITSMGMALGFRLKLFDALASIATEKDPKTAADVARETNLNERCVREWLALVACGGLVEVDESGERFWIPAERKDVLAGPNRFNPLFCQFLPIFGNVYEDVVKTFQNGPQGKSGTPHAPHAPHGHHASDAHHASHASHTPDVPPSQHASHASNHAIHGEFINILKETIWAMRDKHLLPDFMPLTGLVDKLSASPGLQVLDVGCGAGVDLCLLAKAYPNSHITGLDINSEDVEKAKQRARPYPNTTLLVNDASDMPKDWTEKFDFVNFFEALHHQARPELALAEIHRVLKPGGVFTLLEFSDSSSICKDKQAVTAMSAFKYGLSLIRCSMVGSSHGDSTQVITINGVDTILKLLENAGFKDVQVIETPFFPWNILFLCKKNSV